MKKSNMEFGRAYARTYQCFLKERFSRRTSIVASYKFAEYLLVFPILLSI